MDDEFHDLEAELGRLRPAAPSRELLSRIERELAPRHRLVGGWIWAAMPAAAAFAIGAAVFNGRPAWTSGQVSSAGNSAARQGAPALEPVSVQDTFLGSREEGYVTLSDGEPARRVREAHLDTIVWKDPRGAESLRWSVPREEVRIIPVRLE